MEQLKNVEIDLHDAYNSYIKNFDYQLNLLNQTNPNVSYNLYKMNYTEYVEYILSRKIKIVSDNPDGLPFDLTEFL